MGANCRAPGKMDGVRAGLLAGGVFALAFLAGQLWAWRQLDAAGYYLTANPAAAFFYLITGVHGLHLFGRPRGLGAEPWIRRGELSRPVSCA